MDVDRVGVKCVNCDADGHRARDCPEPRKDKFACRNCKYEALTLYQRLELRCVGNLATRQRSARSLAPPKGLNARSATKVCLLVVPQQAEADNL